MPAENKIQTQSEAEEKMVDLPDTGSAVDVEIAETKKTVNPDDDTPAVETEVETASSEEMDDYGQKVQTRIDKLTKRLRVKKAELTKLGIDLREGLITKSQYDGDRQDILSDMEKIAKRYRLRMEGYDPVLIREPQIVLDILGQFGLIDKKYAQKKYGMKELEKTK